MSPITILYLVSTLQRTGPTTQLLNLVRNLDPRRFKAKVVTLSPEPADSLKHQFLADGIDVVSLDLSRIQSLLSAKSLVKAVSREAGAKLLHTQGIRADTIASASAFSSLPRVATLRNYPQIDYPLTYGRMPGKLMALVHTRSLKRLDLVVGVSQAVGENLNILAPGTPVTTVMNGVDTDVFSPVEKSEKQRIRDELGIPSDKTVWIAAGHLAQRKDPITLIKGFRNAFDGDASHLLILIGTGPLKVDASELSAGVSNIRLEGRVSDVRSYLKASDYYISASVGEGLPNAALEAMACGLPLLLSDIAPHRQLLQMDTQAGTCFETGSSENLERGFRQMLSYNTEVMRNAAINLSRNRLSALAMAADYQTVYDHLLSQGLKQ